MTAINGNVKFALDWSLRLLGAMGLVAVSVMAFLGRGALQDIRDISDSLPAIKMEAERVPRVEEKLSDVAAQIGRLVEKFDGYALLQDERFRRASDERVDIRNRLDRLEDMRGHR